MEQEALGRTLRAAGASVPDTRHPHGRRPPLPAGLALATAAMVSGARSLQAVGQWGRLQRPEVLRALGVTRPATPSVSTIHIVFERVDVSAFDAALAAWAQPQAGKAPVIALDGKGLRAIHEEQWPGVPLVAAYAEGPEGAGLYLAGCYAVLALEVLLQGLGTPVRESLLSHPTPALPARPAP